MSQIYKEIILTLAENRNFLCDQLSFAHGLMSEKEFNETVDNYFSRPKSDISEEVLLEKTAILINILGDKLDTEFLTVILNCEIDRAENLILKVLKEKNS